MQVRGHRTDRFQLLSNSGDSGVEYYLRKKTNKNRKNSTHTVNNWNKWYTSDKEKKVRSTYVRVRY